jgi:hypothetical protein
VLCCVACSYLRRTYLIAGVSSHFNTESTPLVPVLTHTCASNLGEFHSQRQDQRGSAKPAKRAVAKLGRNSCQLQEHGAIFNLISNIARPSQLQPQRLSPPPRSIAISTQAGRHTEYAPVTAARLLRRLSPDHAKLHCSAPNRPISTQPARGCANEEASSFTRSAYSYCCRPRDRHG